MKFNMESLKNRIKSNMCDIVKKITITHKLDYDKHPIWLHDNIRLSSCGKEPDTVRWIENFDNNDRVFDIGANVGAYSLIMAKYAAKIYAFEPSAFTFGVLVRNIHTNNAFNIVPLNMALSGCRKLGTFAYSSIDLGSSGHGFNSAPEKEEAYRQEILSYSVDDFVGDFRIEPPNHIKLDVDGIELEILKGAVKTISNKTFKSLMVEGKDDSAEMFDFLEKLNFQRKARYDVGSAREGIYNYLFVKKNV